MDWTSGLDWWTDIFCAENHCLMRPHFTIALAMMCFINLETQFSCMDLKWIPLRQRNARTVTVVRPCFNIVLSVQHGVVRFSLLQESGCVSKCNSTATVSVRFVLVCSREVENAEVWKPMYGNESTEVRRKAAYQCLMPSWHSTVPYSQGRREDRGGPGQIQTVGPHIMDCVRGVWGHAPRKFWDFTCSEVCFFASAA